MTKHENVEKEEFDIKKNLIENLMRQYLSIFQKQNSYTHSFMDKIVRIRVFCILAELVSIKMLIYAIILHAQNTPFVLLCLHQFLSQQYSLYKTLYNVQTLKYM